ncbi:MAG: protein kinase [Candidatus Eisenbacteria bacterium]
MIGKTVSHYRIVGRLGEGGMGIVYRAEDTKLARTVALKFLPPEMTRDEDSKERFVQEARAASALDHPNICTIHEIDETDDGHLFICMALYEGETLESRIKRGEVSVEDAVRIALGVAEGLGKAHGAGVVHRDIKPANVFLTEDGQTKILDFGLAKLGAPSNLTKIGSTVGTAAYMSPEQARGEEVDGRTDVWALGVVLYQMVAGRLPFRSDYEQALVYSILNEDPEPLEKHRSGAPPELGAVVRRCLEKNPEDRYGSVDELAADLRLLREPGMSGMISAVRPGGAARGGGGLLGGRSKLFLAGGGVAALVLVALLAGRFLGGREGPAERPMLVVLPLENRGPAEDEYFADGITDAITARLAGIAGLGVISRQSAMQYKKSGKSPDEIGRELNVDYILDGSIQRERPRDPTSIIRIIPNLIRIRDNLSLWAATYDEDMTEVFRVQSEIAERVAQALDVTLLEPERRSVEEKPTENLEAYEYYLQGNDFFRRRLTEQDTQQAIERFTEAVRLDPRFAAAWAALARARIWLKWNFGHEDELVLAQEAVDVAERLAPDLTETQMALGDVAYYGSRDFEKALGHFDTVRRRQPSEAEAIMATGYILRRQGKWEAAVEDLKAANQLNPRDPTLNLTTGMTLARMRRFSEAESYLDRAIAMVPQMVFPYIDKALMYVAWDDDPARAKEVIKNAVGRINPVEFLPATPFSLVRVMPDVFEPVFRQINLATSGIDTASDTVFCYLYKAEIAFARGDALTAYTLSDTVVAYIEEHMERQPSAGYLHSYLGLALAAIGRHGDAVREGEAAVDLLPISKDAVSGPYQVERLAEIYARIGKKKEAIGELESLLDVPSRVSPALLRLDPIWDPLRRDPDFRRLLENVDAPS